jgi:hypothetical protein
VRKELAVRYVKLLTISKMYRKWLKWLCLVYVAELFDGHRDTFQSLRGNWALVTVIIAWAKSSNGAETVLIY